ncbi:hypothetical protein SYYSPA8_02590 [Streptomyces yaizuensis]|uniref:Uncharacterized protein n=1 Tax=Streptomyces yaizuensis TaxID=2989713 RepID=A0ABQ5NS01_9ACTN|nr:hypothetical protein SYYSPA8_02590 [Streptomyces sp. YSPA8]
MNRFGLWSRGVRRRIAWWKAWYPPSSKAPSPQTSSRVPVNFPLTGPSEATWWSWQAEISRALASCRPPDSARSRRIPSYSSRSRSKTSRCRSGGISRGEGPPVSAGSSMAVPLWQQSRNVGIRTPSAKYENSRSSSSSRNSRS